MKTMRQKLIIVILALFAGILTVNSGSSLQAAEDWTWPTSMPDGKFSGGKGTKEDPYLISSCQDLADLSYIIGHSIFEQFSGDYFRLTRDLVFNDNVIVDGKFNEAEKANFKTYYGMGRHSEGIDDEFCGTFDGGGHTISGIYGAHSCLFGQVEDATIRNLTIKDSYLYSSDGYSTTAFIVAHAYDSNISNCHVVNCISNLSYYNTFGGIAGTAGECTFTNCTFEGTINVKSGDNNQLDGIGGIIGRDFSRWQTDDATKFTNCHSKGTICIDGDAYDLKVGGFIGYSDETDATDCSSSMNIEIKNYSKSTYVGIAVGGFFGWSQEKSTFKRCASLGDITIGNSSSTVKFCRDAFISGFGGNAQDDLEFTDCVRSGKILFNGKVESSYISINGFVFAAYYKIAIKALRCICYNEYDFGTGLILHDDSHARYHNPMFGYLDNGEEQDYWGYNAWYCWRQNGDQLSISKNYGTYANLSELKGTCLDQLKADYSRWGTYSNADENQNGLPLPITCGGNVTGLAGSGTSESPYLIGTEAELRALQKGIAEGQITENLYFKLSNDIYMSDTPMPAIGSQSYPFKGTLDGGGYAIVGMVAKDGFLFDALAGTLQNLALVDFKAAEGLTKITPLAQYIGGAYKENGQSEDTNHTGTINNCYVTGDLNIAVNKSYHTGEVSGICGVVFSGSSVNNCYFKGSINVSVEEESNASLYLYGGIYSIIEGAVNNCYASYSLNAPEEDGKNVYLRDVRGFGWGYFTNVSNCYYVRTDVTNETSDYCLSSESELNAKFAGKTGWLQGVYRPVLASAKHYEATSPEGSKAYFDAVPETNPKKNYIYNLAVSDDPYADKILWQLPNVAVYVPSENRDYIVDGRLDQSADFSYTANANATTTVGQLYYNLAQTSNGYHMICLPGVVDKDDLPEGSQVMICGQVTKDVEGKETINVILADSIPAGVPCILYVPITKVANGENIKFVMRSGIVSSTRLVDTNSSLTGTFKKTTVSDYCNTASTDEGTGEVKFTRSTTSAEMQPFTAWITGSEGDVTVVDYLLLDEDNNYITKTLKDYNYTEENKITTNIKLHRTIKSGQWNTVCLPFAMTKEEVESTFGAGTTVEEFESCEYNSATSSYTLKFKTSEDGGIKAGTACLLKPGVATTETIFSIKDRQISCTGDVPAGTIVQTSDGNYQINCQGSYNKQTIGEDKYTSEEIYIINGNKVYRVNSDVLMRGFRCYFICSGGTSSSAPLFGNASIEHDDGTTTSLELIETDSMNDDKIYDIVGRRQTALQKGIMIISGKKKVVR